MDAKYTFLIPAFKSSFLKEALRSIQAQTFGDFLVIISDDCSPEPIYQIVEPFLTDPRFTYRKNDGNIGAEHLVAHWNLLVDACETPYLIMAGDDDVYEPSFLGEMDILAVSYPDVNLLRARMNQIDQTGRVIQTEDPFNEFEDFTAFSADIFKNHLHGIGQYVFKTSYLKSIGGFKDFPLAWFSDDATAILCSKGGSAHSHAVLFHLRNSGLNISSATGHPEYARLKASAAIAFHQWLKGLHSVSDSSYCYSKLGEVSKNLSCKQRLSILSKVPGYFWWSIKNRYNSIRLKPEKGSA